MAKVFKSCEAKLIAVQFHANSLAEAAIVAYWKPGDEFHATQLEEARAGLVGALAELDAAEPGKPMHEWGSGDIAEFSQGGGLDI